MPIGENRRYLSYSIYDIDFDTPVFSEFPPAFIVIRKRYEPCFLLCYLDPISQHCSVAAHNDTGWDELPEHIGEMLLHLVLRIDSDDSPLYTDMLRTFWQKAWIVTPQGADLQERARSLNKVRDQIARIGLSVLN